MARHAFNDDSREFKLFLRRFGLSLEDYITSFEDCRPLLGEDDTKALGSEMITEVNKLFADARKKAGLNDPVVTLVSGTYDEDDNTFDLVFNEEDTINKT